MTPSGAGTRWHAPRLARARGVLPRSVGAWGAVLATGCGERIEYVVLQTHGPDALAIAELWWILLAATGIPALLVILVLLLGLRRRRRRSRDLRERHGEDRNTGLILLVGGVIPLAIVLALLVASIRYGVRTLVEPSAEALTIDVIGRQFWWEVRYPDHGIVTANEVHIPTQARVRLRFTSADVIHSFWVPQLGGKRDMIPGTVTELSLWADDAGVYRGWCAEFCGIQHAAMMFEIVALPQDEFERWLEDRARVTERTLSAESRGVTVFEQHQCGHCHHVEGLPPPPTERMGPDLTHVASRRRLGAGILPNNRGNLGGWILNPQAVKPGNHMPNSTMSPEDLHALIELLEGNR